MGIISSQTLRSPSTNIEFTRHQHHYAQVGYSRLACEGVSKDEVGPGVLRLMLRDALQRRLRLHCNVPQHEVRGRALGL